MAMPVLAVNHISLRRRKGQTRARFGPTIQIFPSTTLWQGVSNRLAGHIYMKYEINSDWHLGYALWDSLMSLTYGMGNCQWGNDVVPL